MSRAGAWRPPRVDDENPSTAALCATFRILPWARYGEMEAATEHGTTRQQDEKFDQSTGPGSSAKLDGRGRKRRQSRRQPLQNTYKSRIFQRAKKLKQQAIEVRWERREQTMPPSERQRTPDWRKEKLNLARESLAEAAAYTLCRSTIRDT